MTDVRRRHLPHPRAAGKIRPDALPPLLCGHQVKTPATVPVCYDTLRLVAFVLPAVALYFMHYSGVYMISVVAIALKRACPPLSHKIKHISGQSVTC